MINVPPCPVGPLQLTFVILAITGVIVIAVTIWLLLSNRRIK